MNKISTTAATLSTVATGILQREADRRGIAAAVARDITARAAQRAEAAAKACECLEERKALRAPASATDAATAIIYRR